MYLVCILVSHPDVGTRIDRNNPVNSNMW